MAPEKDDASDADAQLKAAEIEVESWLADADRPTLPDLVALRRLLRAVRLHVKVVRTS
jgi:hypothetical protein